MQCRLPKVVAAPECQRPRPRPRSTVPRGGVGQPVGHARGADKCAGWGSRYLGRRTVVGAICPSGHSPFAQGARGMRHQCPGRVCVTCTFMLCTGYQSTPTGSSARVMGQSTRARPASHSCSRPRCCGQDVLGRPGALHRSRRPVLCTRYCDACVGGTSSWMQRAGAARVGRDERGRS